MNLLLYYPRLLMALVFRPLPKSHATLQHWVNAHILFLWNQPWRHPGDSFGRYLLWRWDRNRDRSRDSSGWRSRLLTLFFQTCFVLVLFAWPMVALIISLRARSRWFTHWNNLVNLLSVYAHHPHYEFSTAEEPLSSTSVFIPLLYIFAKTGIRMPDDKDEIYAHCVENDIPTPHVFSLAEAPLPQGTYIVKPIDGSGAQGIFLTTDPESHLKDPRVVVQEVIRNASDLRAIWGTHALGTLRFFTVQKSEGGYQVAAAVCRIPVGDSFTDNFSSGNAYTCLNRNGTMGPLFVDRASSGCECHPTTGRKIAGTMFPRFDECVEFAFAVHDRLAKGMPFLNSDIALTDDGPMLVEVNRAPGQYRVLFHDGYSRPIVEALCRGIAQASGRSTDCRFLHTSAPQSAGWKGSAA